MLQVLEGLAVIAIVIALGYVLARTRVLPGASQETLAKLAFFVGAPALLVQTLSRADVSEVFGPGLAVIVASTLTVGAVYIAVARLVWRRPVTDTTIGALCGGYVNAGYLGIPVAVYVLGDASYVAPAMLFQLILLAPAAFVILDTAAAGQRPSLWRALGMPFRNPVTVASLLGLALSLAGTTLPTLVREPLDLVAGMAVPIVLIAYGISLHGAPLPGASGTRRELLLVAMLKNLVQPAAAYLLARFALGLEGTTLLAATVIAALPTAQNIFVYAIRYNSAVSLARDAILVTTLLCAPVLVAIAALLA